MISTQTTALATHLNRVSSSKQNRCEKIDWLSLNHQQFWLPESMLSLYGSHEYASLTPAQRIKLSHYELLHYVEFGIWLEGLFISRLRDAIDVNDNSPSNQYNMHIIREETEHSLMFLKFISHSGYSRVLINKRGLKTYQRLWSLTSITSSLFWAFVLTGEEIPLRLNKSMLKERQVINSTIVDIVKKHTIDESQHVSHASAMLSDSLQSSNILSKACLRLLAPKLIKQFSDAFYYPTQDMYVLAGLDIYTDWGKVARNNTERQLFIKKQLSNILRPLSNGH